VTVTKNSGSMGTTMLQKGTCAFPVFEYASAVYTVSHSFTPMVNDTLLISISGDAILPGNYTLTVTSP
jgi:hypothetical protein